MAEQSFALAHHFEDLEQQGLAGKLGMWVFLITEIMFFGGLFTGYTVYRFYYPEAFAGASHHLDIVLGTVNTAVLIGSSLTMALAVHSAQAGNRKPLVAFLLLTIFLGLTFLGIKLFEYSGKFHENLVPGWNFHYDGPQPDHAKLFFSFYFGMTGMHALHMVVGIGVLIVLTVMAWKETFSPAWYAPVDLTGLYWHFVDIIWIFLFPLLYLIGSHT